MYRGISSHYYISGAVWCIPWQLSNKKVALYYKQYTNNQEVRD